MTRGEYQRLPNEVPSTREPEVQDVDPLEDSTKQTLGDGGTKRSLQERQ